MAEIRTDIVTGYEVIIATERKKRPSDFSYNEDKKSNADCPFCSGREHNTPPEVAAVRKNDSSPDKPGWEIRVVPNKFAAVNPGDRLYEKKEGIYTWLNAKGNAEVVIESPEHYTSTGRYSTDHFTNLINIIQQRFIELSQLEDNKFVQVFKNSGAAAGASLQHPHWQIISVPFIPPVNRLEFNGAKDYYEKNNSCIYCDIVNEEKQPKIRLIEENDKFIAFTPFASRYPFETWIIPKTHTSNFASEKKDSIKDLSKILQSIIKKYENGLNNPPYNLVIHTSPASDNNEFYHWHIEMMPKLTITAGFELGTGCFINIIAPEDAAEFLRGV